MEEKLTKRANEGFEDADKLVGGGTVEKMIGAPMKALQKAVDDKKRNGIHRGVRHSEQRLQ
jgi:hypothetical protein